MKIEPIDTNKHEDYRQYKTNVNKKSFKGFIKNDKGENDFNVIDEKPSFVGEETDYVKFHEAWMSQGDNTNFSYTKNSGLSRVSNAISLVPGLSARLLNGFELSIGSSMVDANGDYRDYDNAIKASQIASAMSALIKVANNQIPINIFYSSRNQNNSDLAREGLTAFGIDVNRPFLINEKMFEFDENGRLIAK